ncbi:hypothetical protein [Streptomyces synnematoformans]|uniref:hypothetical protein n=1 Tax=Streptomyces synnematoformans TaxID=415721 RepID=UPI0031D34315
MAAGRPVRQAAHGRAALPDRDRGGDLLIVAQDDGTADTTATADETVREIFTGA